MISMVLDASALLALIQRETGWERVEAVLGSAIVSSVNFAEVANKLLEKGIPEQDARKILALLHCEVIEFKESDAWNVAALRETTKVFGLSLGDRACLALAMSKDLPALTADRAWKGLSSVVRIECLR